MAKNQGSAGRFGVRFGNTLRKKVNDIEKTSRGKHACPFCAKEGKVRREAYGIWKCSSCGKTFIGKAYTPY
ncbi:MAG: 50S ribosomal protein L37ae [Candidatus Woesearchaeota archaeon]|nr:50S ribosomal protein L37ae [Nanoarchaeota archaeon]USN44434.1 MAG: 50S ribosomal protein L37ae [Candidatus Woesearchaeota archaeon]